MPLNDGFHEIKSSFSVTQLLSLAQGEGLDVQGKRMQCPWRCSIDKRGATVGTKPDGVTVWYCNHCGRGGSVIDLLMATRNLDERGAADAAKETQPHLRMIEQHDEEPPPEAGAIWRQMLLQDERGFEYLKSRGVDGAVALGGVRFNGARTDNGFVNYVARELDCRIAMPLFTRTGALHTIQFRSINPNAAKSKMQLKGIPGPVGGVALGSVGEAKSAKRVYLAEGMIDTLAVQLAGVAVIGAPGADQVKRLPGFLGQVRDREIVLCPQNDLPRVAKGSKVKLPSEQAFHEIALKLEEHGAIVRILKTPAAQKDPAERVAAIGVDAFRAEAAELLDSTAWTDSLRGWLSGEQGLAARAVAQANNLAELLRWIESFDEQEGDESGGGVGFASAGGAALQVVPIRRTDPRPAVRLSPEEHEVDDKAIAALADDEVLYQRGGVLVHVVRDQEASSAIRRALDAPRIVMLSPALLRERITARVVLEKIDGRTGDVVRAHPPAWMVQGIFARGYWPGLRRLAGVTEVPVLRADGTVLETPGYDAASELIYQPNGEFLPVPVRPSREDACAALNELKEIVADFPFAADHHRSTWLAALLSPLARQVYDGCTPLFLFDSNVSGSGKSLLSDTIGHVVLGASMARTSHTQDDEEMRKRVTTLAIEGDPLVLIDNIENGGSLGSPILDAALTSDFWKDRLLGINGSFKGRLRMIWYATGNNVQLRGDMQRRVLHSRLESPMERPTERAAREFRHYPLLPWVRAERPRLLRAALTVLRAHAVAGRPCADGLAALGGFEGWSAAVRAPLAWLGEPDCLQTQRELATAADSEVSLLADVLAGWKELDSLGEGLTVRELMRELDNNPKRHDLMRTTLEELCPSKSGKPPTSQAIGKKLQRFKGRFVGGVCLDHVGYDDHHKTVRWGFRRAP